MAEMGLLGFMPLMFLYVSWFLLAASGLGRNRLLAVLLMLVVVFRFDIGLTQVQLVYHFTTLFYAVLIAIFAGMLGSYNEPVELRE